MEEDLLVCRLYCGDLEDVLCFCLRGLLPLDICNLRRFGFPILSLSPFSLSPLMRFLPVREVLDDIFGVDDSFGDLFPLILRLPAVFDRVLEAGAESFFAA